VALLLLLLLGVYALMRSSVLQTILVHKISDYLSEKLKTEVQVGKVDLELFRTFVLEDVFIRDLHKDTLLFVGQLKLEVKNYNLEKNVFVFKSAQISNTRINLVQYKNERYLNFQFIADAFSNNDTSQSKSKPLSVWCRNFELKNVDFSYRYQKDTTPNFGINYNAAHVKNINALLANVYLDGDTVNAHVANLSAREISGFELKKFKADVRFSKVFMLYKNLDFVTNNSHVSTDLLSFRFKEWDDFNNFEEKVYMSAVFKKSLVEMEDIAYFAPELEGIKKMLTLSGDVHGTVSDLNGRKVKIAFGKNSNLLGDFNLNGLPYLKETFVHIKIDELSTDYHDLQSIPTAPFTNKEYLQLPHNIERLGELKFKGNFTGFYNDFVAYGKLDTKLGTIASDIQLKQKTENKPVTYKGKLITNEFDLGSYYGLMDVFRNITLDVNIEGGGLNINDINAEINGTVASFEFQKYRYKNIQVAGNFAKNIFSGKFGIEEENVALTFDGDIDLTGNLPYLDFTTEIKKADLSKLNLFKTKNNINFSTIANVQLKGDDIDNLAGSIQLTNTNFIQNGKSVLVQNCELSSQFNPKERSMYLKSDFADAEIKGDFNLQNMGTTLRKMLANYIPAVVEVEDSKKNIPSQNFEFKFLAKKSEALSLVLFENLCIYSNTIASGSYNSLENTVKLTASAPLLEIFDKKITNLVVDSKNESNQLNLSLAAKNFMLTDSNSIKNVLIYASASNDSMKFKTQWVNNDLLNNKGKLSGYAAFEPNNKIAIHFAPSEIIVEDSLWTINSGNRVMIDKKTILFSNFILSHQKQTIKVVGLITDNESDKLAIDLTDFNLELLNPLMRKNDVLLKGIVNGSMTVSGLYSNLLFSSSLTFNSLSINDELLGEGSVLALWDNQKESIAINGRFLRGEIPTIGVSGFYYPNRSENNLDFELNFQKTQLKMLEKYTKDIVSKINGTATGDLIVSGSAKKPILTGTLELQRAGFLVDYLNTNYSFSAKVDFKKNEIAVPAFTLYDSNGNKAEVEGVVTHSYFNTIEYDFDLDAKKLFCLNTTAAQNNMYYGKAYASGLIKIYGDLKNVNINIDAKTEKGTQFNIPLSGSEEISENKFVTFIQKNDSTQHISGDYQVDLSGIQLNFDLEVTPDADVQLIFDSKIGDVIKGNGKGNLKMQINTSGQFNMYGDYTINSGDYLFTLKNVINKRFKIDQGSTISWNGDPYDAYVNINAIYKVRTSLFDLLQDENYKQRVPVDCQLKMTDKLFNPTIAFAIDLPNSDERIKNEVKSAIGYENEAELNKQVFSLLVLGRFIPPTDATRSTTTPTSSTNDFGVSSNSSELLSNQISNWLSQTNDQVKLGVKYSPGDEITNKELQVAVSTDLFNDRVSIDGNVGVANNPYAASNIVGDVNIDYKINKDGKFRVKAFNQSNNYATIANNGPYKQGIGVFYREEFDTWQELIKRYRAKLVSVRKISAETPKTN